MRKLKTVFLFVLIATVIVAYQNCTGIGALSPLTGPGSQAFSQTDGNGQPYDGIVYALKGAPCSDGSDVRSRVVLQSETQGKLVRHNCLNITPITLSPQDFTLDPIDSSKLNYNGNLYLVEQITSLTTWYVQMQGPLQNRDAKVYDIDLFETDAATISNLKNQNRIVICNFSSGTMENWRSDVSSFQPADLGNAIPGGQERWVDTRSSNVRSIMMARLDMAVAKGCNGVEVAGADAYANNSGFNLTSATQIEYQRYLAQAAHARGLVISLQNGADIVASLADIYDYAYAEQCFRYNECAKYQPFVALGKAVFAIEYSAFSASQCNAAKAAGLSLAFFNLALDGTRFQKCP